MNMWFITRWDEIVLLTFALFWSQLNCRLVAKCQQRIVVRTPTSFISFRDNLAICKMISIDKRNEHFANVGNLHF